ncbi:MAG TPA: hypothetical protein H9870_09750 [Candidatus Corynebacterium avicola]|uniref:Uncharacterized protein n=1 Tax=Candidatus Corynebacterium avicola TaxID=2838527 RepID=A0A9D1RQK2_9CORY|nr:hypothetical protein [Candidatus Corynebacterium avicola]
MKDPLRIPRVLDALRSVWEAQPDLTLPQVYGILETRGIAWNSTDEEVLEVLDALATERPARLPADLKESSGGSGRFLVETEQPAHRVTIDDTWAAVRPARSGQKTRAGRPGAAEMPQPTVWRHGGVRAASVGGPLTIIDTEGFVHRFGLVSRIGQIAEDVPPGPLTSLSGLRRDRLDGHVYHLQLVGDEFTGASLVVDRTLWLFDVSRRSVERDNFRWMSLVTADVGEPVQVKLADGTMLRLPELERITVLE